MVKTEDWLKEKFEEPIEVEPEEEPNEIGEPEEEPIEIEPKEELIEMEPEEEPIEIEPTEEEPIEMEPEEELVKEPEQDEEFGEEPTEMEPIEEEPTDEESIEDEYADEEPLEEETADEEPLEEEPADEEPLEEEPVEEPYEEPFEEPIEEEPTDEPIEEEPTDEEPIEEEPTDEEPIEEEYADEEPLDEEIADEELLEEEPVEEPYEEPFEETPGEKLLCGGKDLSKETRKRSFELLSEEAANRPDYQRTSKKRQSFENVNAARSSQLQDLDKTYGSQFSVPSDKNQGKFWYKKDRQNLSQNQGSNREIDMTNLYICNFPQSLTTEDLKQLFSKFGPIVNAHVPMDNDSGLNRGYGFVKFTNATHAAAAIDQMNGYKIMGMPMGVNIKGLKSESGQGSLHHEVNKAKLFVQHLPLDVTRVGLIKMFQEFGTIASAYLMKGKYEVFGYVIFSEIASAAQAMARMDGCKIQDKILCVTIADTNRSQKYNYKNDHKNYEDEDAPPGYKKMYRRGVVNLV